LPEINNGTLVEASVDCFGSPGGGMGAKRDYVAEIEEIRRRTGPSSWDNGITKLLFLSMQTARLETEGEELAYFPVAAIAAIESYFRWEIKGLIDSGDVRFINNLKVDELPLKLSHALLVAVHGKRVTIGELISHSVRLNNLDAISKTMGQLLGTDFLALVKDARDPELRRKQGESAPTVLPSADESFARVKRTFELRHIICHEAHLSSPVRLDDVKELCSSCYGFARASRYGVAYQVDPYAPLTLQDAYEAASERVRVLNVEIQAVEKSISSGLPSVMQNTFDAMQQAWRLYVARESDFNASHHMNGNRGALYEQLATESLFKARLDKLKEYAEQSYAALNFPDGEAAP